MIDLPKWPRLLVRGKRITSEQADKVILRTTMVEFLSCNNDRWNRYVKQAFRLYRERDLLWVSHETWDDVRNRLGVLDLQHLRNDRIASISTDGAHGWCNWDGTVGTGGMSLAGKWPTPGEVHEDWQKIAGAFHFLDLTAQLVREEWDYDAGLITGHTPLITWTVGRGGVEMHDEPGDLIRPVQEEEDTDTAVRRLMRPDAEIGVHHKRLTAAVRRTENAARRGK